MKALFISDMHGEEAALEKLKGIRRDYDLVVCAGDIGESVSFLGEFFSLGGELYAIPGNNDPPSMEQIAGKHWLHGKRVELGGGVNMVGFGYSPPTPFGTPGEMEEGEIYSQMGKLPIDGKTILVTHAPPKGVLDEVCGGVHAGSTAVRRIVEEKAPLVLVCGHIHEAEGKEKVGETTVLKLAPAKNMRGGVVEITDGRATVRNSGL